MKLNRTDYVLESASDGGYYAWLQNIMNEMIDEMYMVEEFI